MKTLLPPGTVEAAALGDTSAIHTLFTTSRIIAQNGARQIAADLATIAASITVDMPRGWKPNCVQAGKVAEAIRGGDRIAKVWNKSGRVTMASGAIFDV